MSEAENVSQWAGSTWMGLHPATDEDIAEQTAYFEARGISPTWDEPSLLGRFNKAWSTHADRAGNTEPEERMGGLGSPTYKRQIVDPTAKGNVEFWSDLMAGKRSKEGYYTSADGDVVYGIPPNMGAVHRSNSGYTEGPRPGSYSAQILGDGVYGWDSENEYYVVKK